MFAGKIGRGNHRELARTREVIPLSPPLVSVTGTGLTVSLKLAFYAAASTAYRFASVA
jgi:hypothetical protein